MPSEEQAAKDAAARATAASVAADEAAAKFAKANEAQVAADNKAAAETLLKTPVIISGRVGGAFSIEGPGLGAGGTLFIGGRVIPVTRWDDRSIRGILPEAVSGAVRLQTDKGDRHGVFPTPKVTTTTTTTTVATETVPATATTAADKAAADKAAADKAAADKAAADKAAADKAVNK